MNRKNKFLLLILVPYLLIMAFVFYLFFGPGLLDNFKPIHWKNIKTVVPSGFTIKTYNSKGWEIYSLNKMSMLIKIAHISGTNVKGLPSRAKKLKFRYSPSDAQVYYVNGLRKNFEAVLAIAFTEENKTVYISVMSPSVFSATRVLAKIAKHCTFNQKPLNFKQPSIPIETYLTDLILLAGMFLPLLLIIVLFNLSGRIPDPKYFEGDPVVREERHVYLTQVKKYRRRSSFSYIALTSTRFLVFAFKKPVLTINLRDVLPDISIEGKKIIVQTPDQEKFILRPSDIDMWKSLLTPYLRSPAT